MAQPSEEIKEKLDIVDVIKGYIEVTPAGRNFRARCPFHNEKTPSFMISQDRQMWHCFGCGAGGDIFKFVMQYENIEFVEALRILAEKAGVQLQHVNQREQNEYDVLYAINRAAYDFFKQQFFATPRAQEYCASRSLRADIIELFEVGFAPQSYDALLQHLIRQKFKVEDMVRAGVVFKTEKGRYLDRFRGRVMFPIHNHFGKVVGFSGRILPELDTGETGKYMNSPETPIFNKSRLLYGFWQTKSFIREKKSALLVEGQMDFLMTFADGTKNVVATSGTALTFDHLTTLRRLADTAYLVFDNDNAGQNAAERAIDMANSLDFSVRIVSLDNYKDPADAVVAEPQFIEKKLATAVLAMDFYCARYLKDITTIEKKKAGIKNVLEKIKILGSRIDQGYWVRELSNRVHIAEQELLAELDRMRISPHSVREIPDRLKPVGEKDGADVAFENKYERVAWRLLQLAEISSAVKEKIVSIAPRFPKRFATLVDFVLKRTSAYDGSNPDNETLINNFMLSAMKFGVENKHALSSAEDALGKEADELIRALAGEFLTEQKRVLQEAIANAEKEGNDEKLEKYLKAFDDIVRKMQDIGNGK